MCSEECSDMRRLLTSTFLVFSVCVCDINRLETVPRSENINRRLQAWQPHLRLTRCSKAGLSTTSQSFWQAGLRMTSLKTCIEIVGWQQWPGNCASASPTFFVSNLHALMYFGGENGFSYCRDQDLTRCNELSNLLNVNMSMQFDKELKSAEVLGSGYLVNERM